MNKLARTYLLVAAFFQAAAAAAGPTIRTIKEPETGQRFAAKRSFDGKRHICLGVGVREFIWIDVYAAAFYVEYAGAKRSFARFLARRGAAFRAGGGYDFGRLARSAKLHSWLRWGRFNRVVEMRFVRDVPPDRARKTFEKNLRANLGNIDAPDVKADVQRFLAVAGQREIKKGARMIASFSPGCRMRVSIGGRKLSLNNPKVARALLGSWFGPQPVSRSLRRSLLSRLAQIAP